MKFINKKIVILVLFVVVITTFMFWKNINNEDKLEVVRLKNNNDTNMFAIMLEQSDGTYDESTNLNWPDGYKFNPSKSGCIDASGNDIANSLEFDTSSKKAILKTEKASYCYLYFDKDKSVYAKVVSDYQNNNGASKISSTSAETGNPYDVYYYTGDITNNNILYGGFCWKMVITTETGGVKLIYNGVPTIADDGTKSCNNTGTASQLSNTKAFNSNYISPAYVGYMYNTVYKAVGTSSKTSMYLTNSTTVLKSQSSMTSSSYKYYFGDSVTYNNGTYTLNNAQQYDWSSSYSSMVGKYTCSSTNSTTGTSCAEVYYVAVTTSSTMYYYAVSDGNSYDDYNIKLSNEESTNNGDGTYTLVDPVEITRTDYYNNYSTYKNYYFCSDLTSVTCSDMYYSYASSNTALSYVYYNKNYKYGNSFKYENGTYTLVDTDISSIKQFWNWYTNYNTLSNNHYTCFNTSGECTDLKYIYYTTKNYAYYITLTDGESVEDAISKMFDDNEKENYSVNTIDSTIKDYIDTWYEEKLLNTEYEKYLENAIFCANREITDLGGWNPNGGNTTTPSMYFNDESLECANKLDRFTLKTSMGGTEGYGNNALDYPIGLISYKEASLATESGYLKSGSNYWLLSPRDFGNDEAHGYIVYSVGRFIIYRMNSAKGVRPAVSLSHNVEITSGNGSVTNPYQVILSE